jgi:hypothetical protein
MNDQNLYSDEFINAFVDNELSPGERAELLSAASSSKELSQRICQMQRLKEMLKTAYPEQTDNSSSMHSRGRTGWLGYAAAAVVGAFSVFVVLQPQQMRSIAEPVAAIQPELNHSVSQTGATSRVVFHISNDDLAVADELFDQVEFVLQEYAASGRPIRVEVVANNQGLRLFQQGRTLFEKRIADLDSRYQNITFAACGNTMERIQKETGETIEILPQAVIIRSGISFVARRQKQGWSYIKV